MAKRKGQKENNELQNPTQNIKDGATQTPLNTSDALEG